MQLPAIIRQDERHALVRLALGRAVVVTLDQAQDLAAVARMTPWSEATATKKFRHLAATGRSLRR